MTLDTDWKTVVIGTNTPHDESAAAGAYRSWQLKRRLPSGSIVTAEVTADMNVRQGDDGAHLWGVSWPARKAVWKRNTKGDMAEVTPFLPAHKIGGKAPNRRDAMAAAEAAMRTGAAVPIEQPRQGPTRIIDPPDLPGEYADEPPDDAP